MTIKKWVAQSGISPLDTQLLLSSVLNKPKEWIIAHDDFVLARSDLAKLSEAQERRQNNEPLAYILGKKEFYRRNFIVTPDVLIPRPETEQLVEFCLSCPAKKILDVGTGSGCIAITLKLENPKLEVTASDISEFALKVAKKNWTQLKKPNQQINFVKSDLLENVEGRYDIIIANLPYVDESWPVSPETSFEPRQALFAPDNGLGLIKKLINTAPDYLNTNGILILELDSKSAEQIKEYSKKYTAIHEKPFMLVLLLATAH